MVKHKTTRHACRLEEKNFCVTLSNSIKWSVAIHVIDACGTHTAWEVQRCCEHYILYITCYTNCYKLILTTVQYKYIALNTTRFSRIDASWAATFTHHLIGGKMLESLLKLLHSLICGNWWWKQMSFLRHMWLKYEV